MKKHKTEILVIVCVLSLLIGIILIAKFFVEPLPNDPQEEGRKPISEEQAIAVAKQEAQKYINDDSAGYELESEQCELVKRGNLKDYCVTLVYKGKKHDLVVCVSIDRFSGEVISSSIM